jgi:hypothetical protein
VTGTDVGSTYDFVTGVSTRSGQTGCTSPANYHCFEAHYSGTGTVGQAITIVIGGAGTPIAPAPANVTEGTAETYPVIIKNFAAEANPNSASPTDASTVRVAHIESVRITATVDPTISFTIAGLAAGATSCNGGTCCGVSTDVTTTATAVPFGSISNLETFYNAAQQLTVTTNASGGYVVTGAENDEMSRDGLGATIIPDTSGDATAAYNNSDDWETATNNGFGYSIQNLDAASVPFEWSSNAFQDCGTDIPLDFCARQFAIPSGEAAQTIFSSTTVASTQDAFVCYRLSVDPTQAAGDYENQVTYTATGTF